MTSTELKKEIQDSGFQVIKKIHLILTVVGFFVSMGVGIGISQTQLASKIDEKRATEIAKEVSSEQLKHFFTDTDGRVLQSQMQELKEKMEKIDSKLDRLLSRNR